MQPIDSSAQLLTVLAACYGDLRSHLARRFGSPLLAEEVVQETWLKLRLARGGPEVTKPRAYLFRIATNLALDHLRAERARNHHVGEQPESEPAAPAGCAPDALLDAHQRLDLVREAVAELPPRCRQVFELHKFDELSHLEIAERLGISRNMVEKHVIRGLSHCRQRVSAAVDAPV